MAAAVDDPPLERKTLCLPSEEPGVAMHSNDPSFSPALRALYSTAESNASEKLMHLKAELKIAEKEQFWNRLMEGMTEVCGAQYGFVVKRILVDDQDVLVEMPLVGEQGSCLMAVAFYYNDGQQTGGNRDYKYLATGAPCENMKHDKVFLVPEGMSKFILDNPNQLPFTAEGYLGVPLFFDGKCFAHFGLMWTQEGLNKRRLSWGTLEMILHSLEDLIAYRLINGEGFAKTHRRQRQVSQTMTPPDTIPQPAIVSQQVITATQSLKPYAKSLSHELRTPMHGVVGMLDVMYATVQEQIEGQSNPKVRQVFQTLRDNIETVQDSSKRAVEAADNVVHAYDMNMQIPETPMNENDSPATAASATNTTYFDCKPSRLIEGSNISANPHKRRRSNDGWHFGNATKVRQLQNSTRRDVSPHNSRSPPMVSPKQVPPPSSLRTPESLIRPDTADTPGRISAEPESLQTPGNRQSTIRQLIPVLIQDSLRVGGRPDSAVSEVTDLGERIEVRTRSSNGEVSQKTIEWSVNDDVPDILAVDERDLGKLITAVFLNAVKFTEQGKITLAVSFSKSRKFVVIKCRDDGDGIPEDFQPELFKPFSREDDSTTRSKEGLGLGLLVAKGLARRLGGDLSLSHTATSGPQKGSEFEIRLPTEPGSSISRTGTPLSRTPEPMRPPTGPRPTSSTTPQLASSNQVLNKDLPSPLLPTSPSKDNSRNSYLSKSADSFDPSPATRRSSVVDVAAKSSCPRPALSLSKSDGYDRYLAAKYPLTFLVAEDNKINRKLLVSMLGKLGYKDVYEAFDGREAVRIMADILYQNGRRKSEGGGSRRGSWDGNVPSVNGKKKVVDVVLMDLWMPEMDGYAATEEILGMFETRHLIDAVGSNAGRRQSNAGVDGVNGSASVNSGTLKRPRIMAVSADVTDEAFEKATAIGMEGFMTKPYRIADLQRLIVEFCVR